MITTISVAQIDDSKITINSSSNGTEEAEKYAQLLQDAYREGEYELHKTYSDSLLLIAQLYDLKEMQIMALNSHAIYYKNRNNKEKAIEIYRDALEKVNQLPNNRGPKSMILINMGNIYTKIGAYDKSIKIMDDIIEITDTVSSLARMKMAAISGQATNYYELKEYDTHLKYAQQTLELAEAIGDINLQQTALNNLTDYYIKFNDFKNALELTEKGLLLGDKELATKTRALLILNNGIAYSHLDSLDQALSRFKESLKISQEKNFYEVEAYSYEEIAKVYDKKGAYQKSLEAQKEYTKLKEFITKEDKKAIVSDLGKDIENKENKLSEAQKTISGESKSKKQNIVYGSLIIIVLAGLLLFYISKKKRLERENIDLRELYTRLKNETTNAAQNTLTNEISSSDEPYSNSSLTKEDRQLHKQRILQYIKLEKPYLNPELRLSELASKLSLSSSHFSEVLHYGFNENFNNFINFYRVTEAQELMKKPDFKDAKIIAIAFDAGFKSKTTFNRVFKNYTGQTPSEYRTTLFD